MLDNLKFKLDELRKLDTAHSIFGADEHRYLFKDSLSEKEVRAYEELHKLVLPEDYRQFVQIFGSQGCGPDYGLMGLTHLPTKDIPTPDLTQAFPFKVKTPWYLEAGKLDDLELKVQQHLGTELEKKYFQEYEDYCESFDRETNKGVLYLCNKGCGMYNVLILKGEAEGTVWWMNTMDCLGMLPLYETGTNKTVSFARWYELWVDAALKQLRGEGEIENCGVEVRNEASSN